MKNASRFAFAAFVTLSAFAAQAGQNFDDGTWPPAAPSNHALTRAEVLADLQAAQQNGSIPSYDFTFVSTQPQAATVVTREQIKAETTAAMKDGELNIGS